MLDARTHLAIDQALCGKPQFIKNGESRVVFTALPEMAADKSGLVHGGFVFGLGDYAAMLAVNHPNVVVGGAEVRFLKPVKTGDSLVAEGVVRTPLEGKKRVVDVVVHCAKEAVFNGEFVCFVLERHVLAAE